MRALRLEWCAIRHAYSGHNLGPGKAIGRNFPCLQLDDTRALTGFGLHARDERWRRRSAHKGSCEDTFSVTPSELQDLFAGGCIIKDHICLLQALDTAHCDQVARLSTTGTNTHHADTSLRVF